MARVVITGANRGTGGEERSSNLPSCPRTSMPGMSGSPNDDVFVAICGRIRPVEADVI